MCLRFFCQTRRNKLAISRIWTVYCNKVWRKNNDKAVFILYFIGYGTVNKIGTGVARRNYGVVLGEKEGMYPLDTWATATTKKYAIRNLALRVAIFFQRGFVAKTSQDRTGYCLVLAPCLAEKLPATPPIPLLLTVPYHSVMRCGPLSVLNQFGEIISALGGSGKR